MTLEHAGVLDLEVRPGEGPKRPPMPDRRIQHKAGAAARSAAERKLSRQVSPTKRARKP